MYKSYFRPFWSYDIHKTEAWLEYMAGLGYHLAEVNYNLRLFKFILSEPKKVTYRIVFFKRNTDQSKGNMFDNWNSVLSNKHWRFMVNETDISKIMNFPTRDGVFRRNTTILTTFGIVFGVVMGLIAANVLIQIILMSLILPILSATSGGMQVVNIPPPLFVFILGGFILFLFLIFVVLSIYSIFKLHSTNKKLKKEIQHFNFMNYNYSYIVPQINYLDKKTEKQLMKSEQMIRKWKFAWHYAPDKLTDWLEKMELNGYNLYKISGMGLSFYFFKGTPQRVKYFADYQNNTDYNCYAQQRLSGWRMMFSSALGFKSSAIWAKQYNEGEPEPEFYDDSKITIKHAKKLAFSTSIIFLPLCILYILIMVMDFLSSSMINYSIIEDLIFLLVIGEFGAFATRSILYYFRIKKKYKEKL